MKKIFTLVLLIFLISCAKSTLEPLYQENPEPCSMMFSPRYTPSGSHIIAPQASNPVLTMYCEYDYTLFQHFNLDTNQARAYINESESLMVVQALKDSIHVRFIRSKLWTTPDPYLPPQGNELTVFGDSMAFLKPKADIYQLVHMKANSGGIAWVKELCDPNLQYRTSVCSVFGSTYGYPTVCWDIEVRMHEAIGHNCGSVHTHDCAWNGNNTKIDDCARVAGYTGDSCPPEPNPMTPGLKGGTIMSYCHLVEGVNINLVNGFGPQPRQVILDNLSQASACLVSNILDTGCTSFVKITATVDQKDSINSGSHVVIIQVTPSGTNNYHYDWLWEDHSGLIHDSPRWEINRDIGWAGTEFDIIVSSDNKCTIPSDKIIYILK